MTTSQINQFFSELAAPLQYMRGIFLFDSRTGNTNGFVFLILFVSFISMTILLGLLNIFRKERVSQWNL